jgi:hypothetical protein
MATAIVDLRSLFYRRANSETTNLGSKQVIASANIGKKDFYIHQGVEISISNPKATAIVMQPFIIAIAPTEDEYIASSRISNVYELEATPGQAVRNYLKALVDELVWLQKHEDNLSASIHRELRLLQNYLRIV